MQRVFNLFLPVVLHLSAICNPFIDRDKRDPRETVFASKVSFRRLHKMLPQLHSFQLYRDGVHRREINRTAVSLSGDGARPLLSQHVRKNRRI